VSLLHSKIWLLEACEAIKRNNPVPEKNSCPDNSNNNKIHFRPTKSKNKTKEQEEHNKNINILQSTQAQCYS
jgi:hypothetical protein